MNIFEKSSAIWRLWCTPRCRSYGATFFTAVEENTELMFSYDKPFSIPFLCCCRPKIKVFDHEEIFIGSVINKFKCFTMTMLILGTEEEELYEISASKCTPGFWCEPLWSSCSPITFDIKDSRKEGTIISKIVKHTLGCGTDWLTNADNYYLDFSSVMSYEERVLLTVGVHEIDMLWFERKCPFFW